ncbi:MAG: hypothetical protein DRP45_11840 [Candidatus Zixiibacteriota bacterium]|nr:MAG: hypothetical protein DRP45_11840 [candidate division Zixibacteria bacterium]
MDTNPIDEAMADVFAELELSAKHESGGESEHPDEWVPNWYLQKLTHYAAEREKIKIQFDRRMAEIARREHALSVRWGSRAMAEVDRLLAGGKKRSVDFEFGRAGHRRVAKSVRIDIEDMDTLIIAAAESCPDAIKTTVGKKELKDYMEKTGEELPGMRVVVTPAHDTFYIGSQKFDEGV